MNYLRAIFAGTIAWFCVVMTFYILEHISIFKKSLILQAIIAVFAIIFYAFLAAKFYYRKAEKKLGFLTGIVITATALILDVLITVPFIEIPKGSSYQVFFSNPLLWILVAVNIVTVYFYQTYYNSLRKK